jgi:hypothetical protein
MIQIPLWLYAAIMAAGTGAQYAGQRKVDNERAKAMAEERTRREKLTRENEATADKSRSLFANQRAAETAKAAEIKKEIAPTASHISQAPGSSRILDPASPQASTATVDQARKVFAEGDARRAAHTDALAQAGAFGSVFGDAGRSLARNAQDIDMNTTSMGNWNRNVLPVQLEAANQSGRDWSTAGDVLKLVGSIMAPWALGGGGANAAANSTSGVLDQMSGLPKAFAGRDLFSMGQGLPFSGGALGTAGLGIMADERLQELRALRELGQLSLEEMMELQKKEGTERWALH